MAYILPDQVVSPRRRWHSFTTLLDNGEGNPSYALGMWDGKKVIVFRWNGCEGAEGGNPQSRGYPTWIVLDDALRDAVIDILPPEKQQLAKAYLFE